MDYTMKRFETKDGPLVLEFDFAPPRPTDSQLEALVPHVCETCEWKNWRHTEYCGSPQLAEGEHCTTWIISLDAYGDAHVEYYKELHKKHYG